jgi:hypothetical protein
VAKRFGNGFSLIASFDQWDCTPCWFSCASCLSGSGNGFLLCAVKICTNVGLRRYAIDRFLYEAPPNAIERVLYYGTESDRRARRATIRLEMEEIERRIAIANAAAAAARDATARRRRR